MTAGREIIAAGLAAVCLYGCTSPASPPRYAAQVERTAGGIPHITAADWGGLGFGTGYVMAEDNIR